MYGDLHDRLAHVEHRLSALEAGQGRILDELRGLRNLGEKIMAIGQDIEAIVGRIDKATDDIAAELRDIKGQLSGGLGATEAAALQGRLDAAATKLEGIGKDPSNPVPTEPPVPTPPAAGARGPKKP
jgi:hypothetical protein